MSTCTYSMLEPDELTTRMRISSNANLIQLWYTKDWGRPISFLKCHFFSCVSPFLAPLHLVIYFLLAPLPCCYLYSILSSILYFPSPLSQLVPLSHSYLRSIFLTLFLNFFKCWYILWVAPRACLCSQQFIPCNMALFFMK